MTKILLQIITIALTNIHAASYVEYKLPSNRIYTLTNEICCTGTIYENVKPSDHECCGSKLIEKKTQMCCFPEVYPRQPNIACCGNKPFNTLTHACVTPVRAYTGDEYMLSNLGQSEIFPVGVNVMHTCGNKIMNLKEEICCNYQISKDRTLDCCSGTTIYDPTKNICCGQQVVLKNHPNDNHCCGKKTFNSINHFCKNDTITDLPPGRFSICGNNLFNPTKEACCLVNKSSLMVLRKAEPNHDDCCGHLTFNSEKSRCCRNEIRTGVDDDKLYIGIDLEGKSCCGTDLIGKDRKCCDGISYNSKSHKCCKLWTVTTNTIQTRLYEKPDGKCCGLDILDIQKEECCGKTVIPKVPDGKSGCCTHMIADLGNDTAVPS